MIADGRASSPKPWASRMDLTKNGMGARRQRYAMIVKDGVVEELFVEKPGEFGRRPPRTCSKQL